MRFIGNLVPLQLSWVNFFIALIQVETVVAQYWHWELHQIVFPTIRNL